MLDLHRAQGPRVQELEPGSRLEFRLISPTEAGVVWRCARKTEFRISPKSLHGGKWQGPQEKAMSEEIFQRGDQTEEQGLVWVPEGAVVPGTSPDLTSFPSTPPHPKQTPPHPCKTNMLWHKLGSWHKAGVSKLQSLGQIQPVACCCKKQRPRIVYTF